MQKAWSSQTYQRLFDMNRQIGQQRKNRLWNGSAGSLSLTGMKVRTIWSYTSLSRSHWCGCCWCWDGCAGCSNRIVPVRRRTGHWKTSRWRHCGIGAWQTILRKRCCPADRLARRLWLRSSRADCTNLQALVQSMPDRYRWMKWGNQSPTRRALPSEWCWSQRSW